MVVSMKLSLGLAALAVMVTACAPSGPASEFRSTSKADAPAGTTGELGAVTGDDGAGSADEFESCATRSATAEPMPVYLVFMFDKSGSMTSNTSPKWAAAKAASRAFFESPDSSGVSASLTFFPDAQDYSCSASAYSTPQVAMTALPNAAFGASLDSQSPAGGTPTHVALQGAMAYAQGTAPSRGKVAIVLVTDGLPDSSCTGNSVGAVRDLAASVAGALPTYVIGVGDELASLNEIAAGGGTGDAFIVSASDPRQLQQEFLGAINTIKASALACDYAIPAAPAGERLDRAKVNVVHVSGASRVPLAHDATCSGGSGWRYDDAEAPQRIVLCDASCDAVKAKPGRIEVLFGCATDAIVK